MRDSILMAVDDMDVLNAITKVLYPTVIKETSDNGKPGGAGDTACDRSCVGQRQTGYT